MIWLIMSLFTNKLKTNKEISFFFASILSTAIDKEAKFKWMKNAISLVFENILAFKGERLMLILLQMKNWFEIDDFNVWEISEEAELKDSLDEIIDVYTGEIQEIAIEMREFLEDNDFNDSD